MSYELWSALDDIARAIKPRDAMPGHDAAGGTVDSLTEAVMGITAGLVRIAEALHRLADAHEDAREPAARDAPPSAREACPKCAKPMATEIDWRDIPEGEGEWLCWGTPESCETDPGGAA